VWSSIAGLWPRKEPELVMSSPAGRSVRAVSDIYTEPGVEWQVRFLGMHLHPGFEEATVALAARAAHYGFPEGGSILDLASALGGPARFLARRFAATVICIDLNPRMHAALTSAARAEGLTLCCLPVLARTEHLPLATASCDGAWSQDALCHMDKPAVIREVARVLRPDALFAFTDFIARSGLTNTDAEVLAHEWGFVSLQRLAQYTTLLDAHGFEVLLAEDRTSTAVAQYPQLKARDQQQWEADFAARHGEAERQRQRDRGKIWLNLLRAEQVGYGMFVGRRRSSHCIVRGPGPSLESSGK
jgi:SAM-dependent methyltransferase